MEFLEEKGRIYAVDANGKLLASSAPAFKAAKALKDAVSK